MSGATAVLGLDIGSSGAKARVLRPDGSVASEARVAYRIRRDCAGAMELEPAALVSAVGRLIEETVGRAGVPVAALAIGAVGEAIVPVDDSGEALAPALLSADRRLAGTVNFWLHHGDELEILDLTGLPPRDMWSANAMRFHAANPEVAGRLHVFRTIEDMVVADLGVTPRMAISQAARSMLWDRRAATWNHSLLSLSGLPEGCLPEVALPGDVLGELPAPVFGLPAGTVVASGGHDQFLAALGAGAGRDIGLWSSGTVESLAILSDRGRLQPGLPTYQVDEGLFSSPVPNLNGGIALDWLCRLLGRRDMAELLDGPETGSGATLIVPTLGPTGAPDYAGSAAGLFAGLSYDTEGADLARAMVRGIVHESAHAASLFGDATSRIKGFALAGGGSRSDYWNRWRAAALGLPVQVPTYHDCGCIGAARLAWQALSGARPGLQVLNPPARTVAPDPADIARFRAEHELYLDLRRQALARRESEVRS